MVYFPASREFVRPKAKGPKTLNGKAKNNEAIIYPCKGTNEPLIGPDALMVMIPSELVYLVRLTKAKEVSSKDMNLYRLYQTVEGTGAPITLSGPFLGAPQAVIGMEKLIVSGARRIWALGLCGSLQHNVRIGDIVIPSGAVSEEGTSRHYPIIDQVLESDTKLTLMLEEELTQLGLTFSKGKVWTTDAVYRETRDKVRNYQEQGILAVEMEISALMTLALYRSVAMAGVLVVSDELFDLKWRPGFSSPLLKESLRAAGKALLSLAGSLTKQETLEPESP
jgi:uridine phosphorylase